DVEGPAEVGQDRLGRVHGREHRRRAYQEPGERFARVVLRRCSEFGGHRHRIVVGMTDWSRLVRPSLVGVDPYRPGATVRELRAAYGLEALEKLNSNDS